MPSPAREVWAAISALFAYLTTVLPRARRELRAFGPLPPGKKANAEAVAVFATLAPRRHRAAAVRAIVTLQVEIDLRDAGEEEGWADDPEFGELIVRLDERWRRAVVTMPSWQVVKSSLDKAVDRCEHGQIHTHRAAREGPEALRRWALSIEPADFRRWWEIAAGSSSSVAAHALIAAAADPDTTIPSAVLVLSTYQLEIAALTVLLDDLVDREEDLAAGEHNYLAYYETTEQAAERLAHLALKADLSISGLRHAARHHAILAGVAGFYLSAAAAETPYASPIRTRLLETLGPGARILTAFMRLRRLGERKRPEQAGNSPGP